MPKSSNGGRRKGGDRGGWGSQKGVTRNGGKKKKKGNLVFIGEKPGGEGGAKKKEGENVLIEGGKTRCSVKKRGGGDPYPVGMMGVRLGQGGRAGRKHHRGIWSLESLPKTLP